MVSLSEELSLDWSHVRTEGQILAFKISRRQLVQLCQTHQIEFGDLEILVSGLLTDGTLFGGVDTIRIISPGR